MTERFFAGVRVEQTREPAFEEYAFFVPEGEDSEYILAGYGQLQEGEWSLDFMGDRVWWTQDLETVGLSVFDTEEERSHVLETSATIIKHHYLHQDGDVYQGMTPEGTV